MRLTVLSLGAGVQSSTMALMAAAGDIGPMPDCAIFADTEHEPKAVYEWLSWLETRLPFPVHRVGKGDLWKSATTVRRTRDGLRTYVPTGIPVYTVDGLKKGIGKRQCTRDFKIDPVNKKCRELLGLKRVFKRHGKLVEMWMGISTDEIIRIKPARKPWIEARWPLIEKKMSRAACLRWMEARGFPAPPRSACTFCPFRDDDSWLALTPEEFSDAARKETELQAAYSQTTELRSVPFFHDSRVPLSEVKLTPGAVKEPSRQGSLFGDECEGICGV